MSTGPRLAGYKAHASISNIERGDMDPSWPGLIRIVDAMKLDPSEFLRGMP